MAEKTPINLLNEMLDCCVSGEPTKHAPLIFGNLFVTEENRHKFDLAIDGLYDSLPAISTLSKAHFKDLLLAKIGEQKPKNLRFTEPEWQSFREQILGIPVANWRVFRPIHGVTIPPQGEPVKLGKFTIYDRKCHSARLLSSLPNSSFSRTQDRSEFLIECTVNARDSNKALELADALFYRFELIMRFFIGNRTGRFEVGVLNYIGAQLQDYVATSENQISQGGAWQGALQPLPISDPYFTAPMPAFERILQILEKQNNDFEAHVLRFVEWTGQAIAEPNAASAFVKAAIALEVLFSANEKGLITPSIMSQIAESCAFILGDSSASASEFEREVKRLYGVRSAVVHSGKDSVSLVDLHSLIQICRDIVIALLSDKEFQQIDSVSKLGRYFRAKKYSSLEKAEVSGQSNQEQSDAAQIGDGIA